MKSGQTPSLMVRKTRQEDHSGKYKYGKQERKKTEYVRTLLCISMISGVKVRGTLRSNIMRIFRPVLKSHTSTRLAEQTISPLEDIERVGGLRDARRVWDGCLSSGP